MFVVRVSACLVVTAMLALPAGTAARQADRARSPAPDGACTVPGTSKHLDDIWRPDMAAAMRYAAGRSGDIEFAVRTPHRFYGYRPDVQMVSASVIKAMFMVAYLNLPSVRNRALDDNDRSLLIPMITQSNNDAASEVRDIVGDGALYALAGQVHMTRFWADPGPIWGDSLITARDQTKFFLYLDQFVAPLHRGYALHLLASITPSQRWGIGEVAPKGWKLYFKGGWGEGIGLVDHQVALLTRGCARISIAVMTLNDGSHAYGKATLRGIFARLLKGLPK